MDESDSFEDDEDDCGVDEQTLFRDNAFYLLTLQRIFKFALARGTYRRRTLRRFTPGSEILLPRCAHARHDERASWALQSWTSRAPGFALWRTNL